MSIKISPGLRKLYAEKVLELANIGAGATLFSQFLTEKGFSWLSTFVGFGIIIVGYVVSYLLYPKRLKL
ncbi:hypothetical protein A2767_04490 [Candidatus Roizmanbacteria bacterium RIFCSPHIGHO2_01_FULL_35_10]|uniref:Major facilitator superfamily (MFS) profile domain-containing protein n=1 Tax=Candidatus Roizmanbacteria bacterium RIFCSPLOWO2_01_FULL_35_13 TaxID=1802055 RepID=A0A1F7IH10_9BACT|nr:MAG: hypothetical protein A2767_04490 [Candidatus Roizmanbacteria bacterium RIFCSPHIGHO2_01_FULL_35_10]OGK42648.1 MAG: hypothetical protein A3A74_06460 [Candidatus Roizmanbacteria bacterium RIFCSPLOWO2_01_FULL_35_13]